MSVSGESIYRRFMRAALLVLLSTAIAVGAAEPAPRQEIDNVAAFARLYGVVRYFYPSDAAAGLDWNRFAVHGVARVGPARDAKALLAALEALFTPLGAGIEIGRTLKSPASSRDVEGPLVAWRHLGAGLGGKSGPYASRRTHRSAETGIEELRGKAIRLRAKVRATVRDEPGWAALWLRVDRPDRAMGFFDNMDDRRIREAQWREYAIEGLVAEDAVALAFGVMAFGAATADFDAVALCLPGAGDACAPIPIDDPGFEAALDVKRGGWMRAGTSRTARVSHVGEGAPEGRRFLRFEPPASGSYDGFVNVMQTLGPAEPFEEGGPTAGAHADVDLGLGLKARVPLTLSDAQARVQEARKPSLEALRAALAAVAEASREPDLDRHLADVVVAWNVFRHFYPYWTEAGVDWDARLRPQLAAARGAETRAAQRDALRGLVADARDGHGSVTDTLVREERARLPIQLGVIEDKLVITASGVPETPVGAVVTRIDGVPAAQRLSEAMRLVSGTPQWRQVRALWDLTTGPEGATLKLSLDSGTEAREVTLEHGTGQPPLEKRPAPVAELKPQLWYVDLTRAKMAEVTPMLEKLAGARGVVFDLRGYPGDAGSGILPHLMDAPEADRWMHVAKLVGPFGRAVGWQGYGWDLRPASPRLAGKNVFLTDGRAISYAESVMGYVADRKLGTIVGSPTAGTNGNVASFEVPSRFRIGFTGMRVTRHDGQAPHHLIGVQPDISVAPTIAGLRSGRDEVLERALALIR